MPNFMATHVVRVFTTQCTLEELNMKKKEMQEKPKKVIGLIGPDSSGIELGRLTQDIYDGLKDDYIVIVSYDGVFIDSSPEIILYCGKYDTQVHEVVLYCKKTGATLVGVGDFWEDYYEGWNDFTFIQAHNMSLTIATLIMRVHEDGLRNRITSLTEYHQSGRVTPTSAVKRIAQNANYSGDITSKCGVKYLEREDMGSLIPSEHEDNFSIYKIGYIATGNTPKDLMIVDCGTKSKVDGARALCDHFTGPYANFLDKGIYSFQYLVNAKFI